MTATGFEGDDGFVFIHAMVSYSLLLLTFLLNILVFLLVKTSRTIDSFRYVFYTYCVTNIILSMIFSTTLTQWTKSSWMPGVVVFFPTGPLAHNTVITPYVWQAQNLLYFFVLCLLCATFVYRYFAVVEPTANKFKVGILTLLNFIPVPLWVADSLLLEQPNEFLRKRINQEFGEKFAINFEQIHFTAFDTTITKVNALEMVGVMLSFIQMSAMIWTGVCIRKKIQESIQSKRSSIVERSAFRLLLSQAINPLIFLHIPTILNVVQSGDIVLPVLVNRASFILMHVFTVTNPLLNIFLSRDLSNSLKSRVLRRKKSSVSILHL